MITCTFTCRWLLLIPSFLLWLLIRHDHLHVRLPVAAVDSLVLAAVVDCRPGLRSSSFHCYSRTRLVMMTRLGPSLPRLPACGKQWLLQPRFQQHAPTGLRWHCPGTGLWLHGLRCTVVFFACLAPGKTRANHEAQAQGHCPIFPPRAIA